MCSIKRAHKRKYLQLNSFLEAAAQRKKKNTRHRAIAKIPYRSVSGCHPEKKKKCVKTDSPPKEERNDHQMQTMDEANAVQEIEFTD